MYEHSLNVLGAAADSPPSVSAVPAAASAVLSRATSPRDLP